MIIDLGRASYREAYRLQRQLVRLRKLNEIGDTAVLVEHEPVYTIGKSGSRKNLLVDERVLRDKDIEVIDVDRGGDITFHGPGQLVLYLIVDLKTKRRDLFYFMRQLEEIGIGFLGSFGVMGYRMTGKTGVWVRGAKIASIGIAAKDWITYHGMSINVNVDMRYFALINPCGMRSARITSLRNVLGSPIDPGLAKRYLIDHLQRSFTVEERFEQIPALV